MESEPWELPARAPSAAPPAPADGLPGGTSAEPWELPSHSVRDVPTEPVPLLTEQRAEGDPPDPPPPDPHPPDPHPPEAAEVGPTDLHPGARPPWRTPVRHPRRAPGLRGVPVAAVLTVAVVALGGTAWMARQVGGGAGHASDTASTSGLPSATRAGATRGSGVVGGTSTRSPRPAGAVDTRPNDLRRLVSRVRVPSTAPPARDASGASITYAAAHLVDGNPSTAWRMRGDGRGRTITLTFTRPVRLARVGLVNGYAKVDPASGADRYSQQRRVTRVRWRAGGASPVTQTLADGVRAPQLVALVTPPIRTLTLTIVATVPGEPRFDFTAIGEIEIEGR